MTLFEPEIKMTENYFDDALKTGNATPRKEED
jgi:hypothetical protein